MHANSPLHPYPHTHPHIDTTHLSVQQHTPRSASSTWQQHVITHQSHINHTSITRQSHVNHTPSHVNRTSIACQSHVNHTSIARQSHGNHTSITRQSQHTCRSACHSSLNSRSSSFFCRGSLKAERDTKPTKRKNESLRESKCSKIGNASHIPTHMACSLFQSYC